MNRSAELDLTSGGFRLPFGPGHAALNAAADRANGTSARVLSEKLKAATSMGIVALHDTAAAALAGAVERARADRGRDGVIVARGAPVEIDGARLVAHGDTLQAAAAVGKGGVAALVTETVGTRAALSVPAPAYFRRVREACDEHGSALIVDDTRTSFGRTGSLFGFQGERITPDYAVISLAVAEGCDGVALLAAGAGATEVDLGDAYARGCGAAAAALDMIESEKLLRRAKELGKQLKTGVHRILEGNRRWCMDSRGRGLVRGLSTWENPARVVETCAEEGLVVGTLGRGILLAPPLTIEPAELDAGLDQLEAVLAG